MANATITGPLVRPDNPAVGVQADILAMPQTVSAALPLPGTDGYALGPCRARSDETGAFTLTVPIVAGVLWKIYARPLFSDAYALAEWTVGFFEITATTTLKQLVPTPQQTVATPTQVSAIFNALAQIESGKNAAFGFANLAAISATDAQVAKQQAQDLVLSDLGITDGQGRALIDNPNSEFAKGLTATYARILASDGTDQTAIINAALAAPAPGGGKKTVKLVGKFEISATLVMSSRTKLDTTDAVVTLKPGADCQMVQNRAVLTSARVIAGGVTTAGSTTITASGAGFTSADVGRGVRIPGAGYMLPDGPFTSAAPGPLCAVITAVTNSTTAALSTPAGTSATGRTMTLFDRDVDLELIGGEWHRGANSYSADDNRRMIMFFRRVDGLTVHPKKITSTDGKYAINPGDCTNVDVALDSAKTASDIVHLTGPIATARIHDVRGRSHDDSIAFGTGDYDVYGDVAGDITDLTIERIDCYNEIGTNVHGFVTASGNTVKNVTIDKIAGYAGSGYAVSLDQYVMSQVTIGKITTARPANAGFGVQIVTSVDVLNLTDYRTTGGTGIVVAAGYTVGTLRVRDYTFTGAPNQHFLRVSGTVTDLFLSAVKGSTSNGYVISISAGGAVTRTHAKGIVVTGGSGFLDTQAGPTAVAGTVWLDDALLDFCNWVAALGGATTMHMNGVKQTNPQSGSFYLPATAALKLFTLGSNEIASNATIVTVAGYSLRVNGPGFPLDFRKITAPVVGDTVVSTEGSTAPFDGLLVRGSSSWKNVFTGATS